MGKHLTPTELARELGLTRREVIYACMDLGVGIRQGRISVAEFKAKQAERESGRAKGGNR